MVNLTYYSIVYTHVYSHMIILSAQVYKRVRLGFEIELGLGLMLKLGLEFRSKVRIRVRVRELSVV